MEKKNFVKDIQENQSVDDLFLIKETSRAETRNRKPYLILTVMDRTGEIGGRLWEDVDRFLPACRAGNIVHLRGQAQTYKGTLQLKVESIRALEKDQDNDWQTEDFLPTTNGDIPAMAEGILSFARSVSEPNLHSLLLRFFRDKKFFTAFQHAPAAKRMHHAYHGGLLEHTLAVARLADTVAGLYPLIDRSLLITGALLHDVGKTEEFAFDSYPYDYTDRGRLVGHLVLGVEMIMTHIGKIADFPAELATRLQHLILSHHGRHEFGSPCLPMTVEAFVLSFIDDLDAKINYLEGLSSQISEPGYQWTDFQKTLERFLFLKSESRPATEQNPASVAEDQPTTESDRQQSLF